MYFPKEPPTPPSPSAESERYKLREGLKNIITSYPKLVVGEMRDMANYQSGRDY